jgi:oligo-1,6-glucosidase
LLDRENPNVYAYTRELNGKKLVVAIEPTDKIADYSINLDL